MTGLLVFEFDSEQLVIGVHRTRMFELDLGFSCFQKKVVASEKQGFQRWLPKA